MKRWLIDSGLGASNWASALALVLPLAAAACGADGTGLVSDCGNGACLPPDSGSNGGGVADTSMSSDATTPPSPDATSDAAATIPTRSPLCGVSGCFPGSGAMCPSTPPADAGDEVVYLQQGEDGEDGDLQEAELEDAGAPAPEAGANDEAAAPVSEAGGGSADASVSDAALVPFDRSAPAIDGPRGDATPSEGGDESAPPMQSCYVKPMSGGAVTTAFALAGNGASGSACTDSSNCAPFLACVQVDGRGVCRPFSCGLPIGCCPGTFYNLAPLVAGGAALAQNLIPVCSPNQPCPLLQMPTPCTGGKVCAVVGEGETTCLTPGSAKQNEFCDESIGCSEGLVCSLHPDKTQNKCLKLCHVDSGAVECPGGTCQGGNKAIPSGFGICVGDTGDGG